jgi:hypothetical protein
LVRARKMIETVGDLLHAFAVWLRQGLAATEVTLLRASDTRTDGVSLIVTGVAPAKRAGNSLESFAVDVSALLVADRDNPAAAATLAGELAFLLAPGFWLDAEGERREIRVEDGAVDACRSLGLNSPLAILTSLPFARARQARRTKPVLEPLVVEIGEIGQLEGVVLGAAEGGTPKPMPGALVSAPDFARSTLCGADGRFQLTGLPPQGPVGLTVSAKGRSHDWTIAQRSGVRLVIPI